MTRYRSKQSKRNREQIIELRTQHPEMTLEAIGNLVSLTKERVRQILIKEGLTTLSTGHATTAARPAQPCKQCGNIDKQFKAKHAIYCSTECKMQGFAKTWVRWREKHPDRWTTYQCAHCGKDKTVRTTYYKRQQKKYQNQYCSPYCNMASQWADKESNMSNRTYRPRPKDGLLRPLMQVNEPQSVKEHEVSSVSLRDIQMLQNNKEKEI